MINVVRFIIKVIFGVFYRVELIGTSNIPKNSGALLCANHIGELDMFFIGYKIKRLVRWMAKEQLFKIPLLSQFITWVGAFPIKRGKADVQAIKTALDLIEQGHIVGMFPEGTRTRGKEKIAAKPGAAMIAIKTKVPIIPVAVQGKYSLFSKIKIVFGEPFKLDVDYDQKYSNVELREISKDIMFKIYSLLEN